MCQKKFRKAAAEKREKIKRKFETGDIYRRKSYPDEEFDQGSKTSAVSNKVSERKQILAKQQAQDQKIKSHAKVKIVDKTDISNQYEFFENYNPEEHKGKDIRTSPPRQSINKQQNSMHDEMHVRIDGLKVDGVVEKAMGTYIDRVKKSENITKNRGMEKAATNSRKVNGTQNQQNPTDMNPSPEEIQRFNDDAESDTENEISSRKPGYLDGDLEQARLSARTRDLKDLFEKWNYENNVYDTAAYNDSIPEYDEIDDSQTTRTIRDKFEKLPHSGRIQNTKQPKVVNRFVD